MGETAKVTIEWVGDYYRAKQIGQDSRASTPESAGALCLILRKRYARGVPGYRVLYVGLITDDQSLAANRAMFERIASEQHGRGKVVARAGFICTEVSTGLRMGMLQAIRDWLISGLKPQYGEDVKNGLEHESYDIFFENIGLYAPLRKYLNTSKQGSPVFTLSKRDIGEIYVEIDDWLDHLVKIGPDRVDAYCLCERALELAESRYGPEDLVTGAYLRLLASCCIEHNWYQEAEEILRRQLDISIKEYGRESSETAGTLSNLAGALRYQDRLQEALPLMRKALKICRKNDGPGSPETGRLSYNLGLIYEKMNKTLQALSYFIKSREILEEALGVAHPNLRRVYSRLTKMYESLGDYRSAAEVYHQQIAVFVDRFGPVDSVTIGQINELAHRYIKWGQPQEAAELYREWLEEYGKTKESGSRLQMNIIEHRARALKAAGRYSETVTCCNEGLEIPLGHGKSACRQRCCLMALKAEALGKMGQVDAADSMFEMAFNEAHPKYYQCVFHRRWVRFLVDWADAAAREKRLDEAETTYWRAVMAIGESGSDYLKNHLLRCLFRVGSVIRLQGRYDDAVDVYHDALRELEDGDGEDDFHVTEALEKLAWLHHRIGQPEKAYKYELRIRKLQKARSRTEYWDDPEEHPPLRRLIHVHPTSEERSSHDGGEPS